MSPQQQLLIVWLTFAALGSAAVIVALVWAVRTGQFAHQDRARHLALEAGIPEEKTTTTVTTTAKTKTTATASPRSAGGFNGKTSPSDARGSAPAASARES